MSGAEVGAFLSGSARNAFGRPGAAPIRMSTGDKKGRIMIRLLALTSAVVCHLALTGGALAHPGHGAGAHLHGPEGVLMAALAGVLLVAIALSRGDQA